MKSDDTPSARVARAGQSWPWRVVIYARYSSETQRDASIEDQIRICRARAEREGWQVVAVHSDHAISGATTQRPGFRALLAAVSSGKADIVLAESLDRFSRDQEHIAAFFKQVRFAEARIFTLSEGDVTELHIGLKGTMGALYLKELAEKTLRGLEGRVRAGRSLGRVIYGYQLVTRLNERNEPDRGLRVIDPAEAAVVRRIFCEYADGRSPRSIARTLNAEGVPGPSGGPWYDPTIRGRATRQDGLLRNPVYIGVLTWNRHHTAKHPVTGKRQYRPNPRTDVVSHEVPSLRIVDQVLWERVQARLTRDRVVQPSLGDLGRAGRFQEYRRPRHLLTGKVFCGVCGWAFSSLGKDYLGCLKARHGVCLNRWSVRRTKLQAQVLDALSRRLMRPEHVAVFIAEFEAEWNRLARDAYDADERRQRELQAVERKLTNLVDAIADGLRAPGLQRRLTELETQRSRLQVELTKPGGPMPKLSPDLAKIYRQTVEELKQGIPSGATEVLEAARALIDQVIVSPPVGGDDPPSVELVGQLTAMLQAGSPPATTGGPGPRGADVLDLIARSVQAASGG